MVFKNPKTDKWEVRCYYKNYKGERKQKTKRGFRTKSEALDWERHFKLQEMCIRDRIFPASYTDSAVRVEFFDDEIERITEIDTLTGEVKRELEHVAIFPNSHYVIPPERMEGAIKAIEAELAEQVAYFKSEDKLRCV